MGEDNPVSLISRSHWFTISAVIQIALVIHVLKTGRPYWWIWILLFFPGIGSAIYVLAEIAPDFRTPSLGHLRWRLRPAGQRIALLQEAIQESDTFANRVALAEEFYRQRKYQSAAETYESALHGLYQDDAYALLDLARCYCEMGDYARAKAALDRLDLSSARELEGRKHLVEARTAEGFGEKGQALQIYKTFAASFPGEEPRYRYALLLEELGQKEQAAVLLREILKKYRKATSHWRKEQKTWHRLAKARLKIIGQAR